MSKLPDYDPDGRCPKSGYDCVKTDYSPGITIPPLPYYDARKIRSIDDKGEVVYEKPEPVPPITINERLIRTCVRCGYRWAEEVVSAKEIDVRSEA